MGNKELDYDKLLKFDDGVEMKKVWITEQS